MNNNLSFFDCVIRPVLVIIGFLIGVGIALSANGDVLTELNNTVMEKPSAMPNIIYSGEYDTVIKDSSTIKGIEDKISRLESVINQDNRLRKLYHGGIPTYTYETNLTEETIQRIDRYPDGYIHIEKGQKMPLITPEKLAKMEIARKNLKVSRIDRLKERIDTLSKSTNAVDAARLEQSKRLLERLERSSTTNYVDVVVKPQTKEVK
jgi:hypothetical protein